MLFNGTVYENIANGLVGTTWEHAPVEEKRQLVQDAAKVSFAHDFIIELAQGYDTSIGQRGGLLSGGQKQRIAIARSIISQPKILLLDEATSALDPHAEGIVQKALDNASRNRTTITIAHKLATIRGADNIVVMSQGRIMEQGTHEKLSQQGGLYEKLVKAQSLAPNVGEAQSSSSSSSVTEGDEPTSDTVKAMSKIPTQEATRLQTLKDREDQTLFKPLGFIRTVLKMAYLTPELGWWYFIVLFTCVAGGKSSSNKPSMAREIPMILTVL